MSFEWEQVDRVQIYQERINRVRVVREQIYQERIDRVQIYQERIDLAPSLNIKRQWNVSVYRDPKPTFFVYFKVKCFSCSKR